MGSIRNYNPVQKRILLVEGVVLLSILAVEARLAYLQILKHAEFHRMAYHQQYSPKETRASRGMIEDRSGDLLAMNIDLFNVCAHPNQIQDKSGTARALAQALGSSYAEMLAKVSGDRSFVWIARQVPYERSEAVENLKLEGVEATREQRRFYPDHEMAAHALGFAGLDNQGLDGLEKRYNASLTGKKGLVMTERDARGRVVLADNKMKTANVDGLNVVTTLDKTIQHIAQVELQKAYEKYRCKAASIAVMDPKTGEILALADFPNYDPNHYKDFSTGVWRDRMVNDSFEPGSTFKLIAASGVLEEGVVKEDDKFFCENGAYHTDYGRVVSDHEKHGWLTFREIFGYSSNIGMVKVSAKLGKEKLYEYAKKFGFGTPTGVDLPGEAAGKLRPVSEWSGLSMTTIPYGYEVSASPMQVLDAYAAIANKGVMMRPYLVKRLETPSGQVVKEFKPRRIRRVVSTETAERMTALMRWVVKKGTGTAVDLPAYDIAGKTGTAYKFMNGHYSRWNYVSSFVGFVPAEDPKYVIYVSLDDPRGIYWGGYTAGPVFKEVAKRALAYALVPGKDEAPVEVDARQGASIPAFVGLTQEQCKWLAGRNGIRVVFNGKGKRVAVQSATPGSPLPSQDLAHFKVLLTMGEVEEAQAKGPMPDLRGKTKRQALALLAPLGLKINFRGEGVVRSQFPPAGRIVEPNSPCDLACDIPVADTRGLGPGGHS
ncbi:MAG TPA: penicillin-binding transpeptidase domain-containing protein [bacterium]|nr:penicillin-binding transpeptidase domain-containing protein [bacterium]